ncbi:cytochrome P450 [Flagelloscypha sp. PMI_526]|nr:cytochrome P450 [Flagelloscypha sp. PMI_526]
MAPTLSLLEICGACTVALAAYTLVSSLLACRRRLRITTPLRGPNIRYYRYLALNRGLRQSERPHLLYEKWVSEFGSIVDIPALFFSKNILVVDPKAVAHFYANDPAIYEQRRVTKVVIDGLLGVNNILNAQGDDHKRLRKLLTPAFSIAAIRQLTDVFLNSAYKAKSSWDSIVDGSGGEAIVEVQTWMNDISLDSIGIAGFGHDFKCLEGESTELVDMLSEFNKQSFSVLDMVVLMGSFLFPQALGLLPTRRNRLLRNFHSTMAKTAQDVLDQTKSETKALGEFSSTEKSIIGLLIRAEAASGHSGMSSKEVMSQMITLLIGGYETTSVTLTWALIELCRNFPIQTQLREEIASMRTNPTYDELSSLPFLDTIVLETLRLHPPGAEKARIAKKNDILPLSRPYTTSTGEVVDRICIAKGSKITAPIHMINCSKAIWGHDATEFKPSRWTNFKETELGAKEYQGYRHILTFSDGPRMCLGKNFAVAELKAVLFVLIKNFKFELPDGPETEITLHRSIIKRPKVVSEPGIKVSLRVKRV